MAMKKPVRAPTAATPAQVSSRSRGALLGLAVGDALGAALKGKRLQAPQFPKLAVEPPLEMTGGGPAALKPGQVTGETQMACCLAESLRQIKQFDAADVTRRYRAWRGVTFDVPEQVQAVLTAMDEGGLPAQAPARHVWIQSGKKAASNTALARTAPIGVWLSQEKAVEARTQASLQDAAITHHDPYSRLACAAFNASLAQAIRSVGEPTPQQMVDAALTALTLAGAILARAAPELVRDIQEASTALQADLTAAQREDPLLYGPELHLHAQQGFVRVAFRLAYWELFHAPSFEAGLLDTVNRGGDSDGNGAITGALLGVRHGTEQIPERWRRAVLEALSSGRPTPLYELYHPRNLLVLAEG